MAGHSKWSQIKRKKEVLDIKKGAEYARLSKEISMAVKVGGSDNPDYNFRLKSAIDRAKLASVPKDIISRAINKYKDNKNNIEEILYEGYGTDGVAIIIEVSTDNRNRTVAAIRHALSKHNGSLGETGCVAWNFRHLGLISLPYNTESELLELSDSLLENYSEYIIDIDNDEENILIFTEVSSLEKLQIELLKTKECTGELIYLPVNELPVESPEIEDKINTLIELLEAHDDIIRVWHNAKFNI